MSLETSAIKLCRSLGMALDSAAPMEIKSAIKTNSWLGGLVMAIPLWGMETILYALILWGMYKKVANIAGIKFKGQLISNVLSGFIVNLIVVFILNLLLDFIVLFGWIGMFVAGYYATRYSGIAYLGILEVFHGKDKMKTRLNKEEGIQAFKESGGESAVTKTAVNGAIDLLN